MTKEEKDTLNALQEAVLKLTDITVKLDTVIRADLESLKTKVEAIPTASVKDDVTNIIGKIDNIPTNNGLRDIEKSLNDVVVTKLNLTHDSVKEIPTNNSLDSLESKLNNLYDRVNQSNIDVRENLRSHISWNREQANGHVNWRVDRLRKEEFNKLVELLCYAFGFPFSNTDPWGKHRANKYNQALKDYFR